MKQLALAGSALLVLLAGGCDSVAPDSMQYGELQAGLSVSPGVVPQDDQFTIRVVLVNPTDQPIQYLNSIGCPIAIGFLRAGVDLGSAFGYSGICPAAPYRHLIAAGDSLVLAPGFNASVPRGEYRIRVALGNPRAGDYLFDRLDVR